MVEPDPCEADSACPCVFQHVYCVAAPSSPFWSGTTTSLVAEACRLVRVLNGLLDERSHRGQV